MGRGPRAPERDLTTELDTLASLLDELPDDLAKQAFTHASWVDDRADSYERLAFLGDVVLSLAVSTQSTRASTTWGAGPADQAARPGGVASRHASRSRAGSACPSACASRRPPGRPRRRRLIESDRVLASVCEAVIGAEYLAFGIDRGAPAVVDAFEDQIQAALDNPVDHKSLLQEGSRSAPRSSTTGSTARTARRTTARSSRWPRSTGQEIGRGEGKTKKAAEQEAAAGARQARRVEEAQA